MLSKSNIAGRRIIAFVIDFFLSTLPLAYSHYFSDNIPDSHHFLQISVYIAGIFLLIRDYLFFGRSIGKRFTGLVNVDSRTFVSCTSVKLVFKSLMTYAIPLDFLCLMISDKSIGEWITNIQVVHITDPRIVFPSSVSRKLKLNERSDALKIILMLFCYIVISALFLAVISRFFF